jgi:catechol 2,3-dioxygenase-like lactoylglutathione lyase family enzyme
VGVQLFRVIVPVEDVERAQRFYAHVLGMTGERIGPGRHYFHCGPVILACVHVTKNFRSNIENIYIAVDDLDATYKLFLEATTNSLGGELLEGEWGNIEKRAWDERSFYVRDPFGNPICFVESGTEFTGGRFVP